MIMRSTDACPEYDSAALFAKIHGNNHEERNEALEVLIHQHASLVYSVANRYRNLGLPFCDLVAEGNIGLIRAAERFDISRGVEFPIYARLWIREAIVRALDNKSKIIRIPCQMAQKIRKLKSAEAAFLSEFGRQPTDKELMEATGFNLDQIAKLHQSAVRTIPFQPSEDNEFTPGTQENFPDPQGCSPETLVVQKDSASFLNRLIDQLDDRESEIIKRYYGLHDDEPQTHLTISRQVGVSRERVRQIQKRSIEKLKSILSIHLDELEPLFA